MLSNRIYYAIKPYIPRTLRIGLRRKLAQLRRSAYREVWPINERAAGTPPNWPGWPEGKRFAIVLTHDVEGSKGLARVDPLMRIEQRHGFRSSFNFVPEREYRVSDGLRETLDQAGFEVGIHGLHHDGKLYATKAEFVRRAAIIREYARRWKASGFRSPFMQHKLAWLHELGLEYDSSTFDTDPFEPQPDGVDTIFPFWVADATGGGYVELPYTLVQDFSLFILLQERGIDVWKKKLDWVAAHGGMVLLNTHPDYMCFDGRPAGDEFPISYYEELLNYANEKYEGTFWQALPREVARYYRATLPNSERNTRRKLCMIAYSGYESDNRVRRYAEALVSRGDQVDVIALATGGAELGSTVIKGVNVRRIQRRDLPEGSKLDYVQRLLRFLITSSATLTREHRAKRYDAIHVHNMPDFLVFAAWYPKWTGVRIILDIHDIVPELYASKFRFGQQSYHVTFLKVIEKVCARFADHVIVSNDLWYEKLVERSVRKENCTVFLNHVDRSIFYAHARTRTDGKFVILFPGSFQWHQGLDIAIRAFGRIADEVPHAELHLYGRGQEATALKQLSAAMNLDGRVKFFQCVDLDQMPGIMADADLGVVPKRADSFGNEAYSTKIMEFMSQGVPVVASRTKIDSFYFDDNVLRFFDSGQDSALADALLQLIRNPTLREALVANGRAYVELHSWDRKKIEYFRLIDSLSTEVFDGGLLAALPNVIDDSLPK
jgi:glycosyltransferase involved in cell wall biosynthesis